MLGRFLRDQRGSVLLEYVIITTLVVLPLVGVDNVMLFNPSGTSVVDPHGAGATVTFGYLGDAFVELYQRIVYAVGLPVP